MIVTVTANPSIDITLEVDALEFGEVNRSTGKHKDPAGKGINVARALSQNGVRTVALFPADAINGQWIIAALDREDVTTVTAPITDEVRQNVTIVDNAGNTTTINDVGPELSDSECDQLLAEVIAVLETKPTWLVAAGSLPGGLDGDFYVRLGELSHGHGVRFACDTSGEALVAVATAGVADMLKPNHEELEELIGQSLPTVGDVTTACRQYLRPGGEILVSLGENGALLVSEHDVLWAGHEPVQVDSTVGAGDSSLAGYLAADEQAHLDRLDPHDARSARVHMAVCWGAAAVQLPGTTLPAPGDITPERVHVRLNPHAQTRIEELAE